MPGLRCPICERTTDAATCPEHRVPLIDPDILQQVPIQPEVGTVIAQRYVVIDVLGIGGMAAVYVATDRTTRRQVALKFMRPSRALEMRNLKRFYQEARVLAAIKHPNVIELVDFGIDAASRMPYLAMALIEGHTVTDEVDKTPLSEARAMMIVGQIARALGAAHARGFAHRDLKPDNVMITDGDKVVVLDFGVAKAMLSVDDRITAPGAAVGTPEFMSPEQARGGTVDARSDLYGLGCMLYTILAGAPPFPGETAREVMSAHLATPAPSLPVMLSSGQPPSATLSRLFASLMAKSPDERPQSADAVADVADALGRGEHENARALLTKALPVDEKAVARASLRDVPTGHLPSHEAVRRGANLIIKQDTAVAPVDLDLEEPDTPTAEPTQWAEPKTRQTVIDTSNLLTPRSMGSIDTPATSMGVVRTPASSAAVFTATAPALRTESGRIPVVRPSAEPFAGVTQKQWGIIALVAVAIALAVTAVNSARKNAQFEAEAMEEAVLPPPPITPPVIGASAAPVATPAVVPPAPVASATVASSPRPVATTRPRPSPTASRAPVATPVVPADPGTFVMVSSDPAGADVKLANGTSLGKTPVRVKVDQDVEVRVVLAGHAERNVTLRKGAGPQSLKLVPIW